VLFGWEDRNGLVPVYFKGQMSSDLRKTNWDHMSSSSSVFLHIARWVFSLRHKSPVWQGQRSVQDRLCSKQMHPFKLSSYHDFPLTSFVSLRLGLISVLGKHHCFLCLVNLDKFIRTMCFSVNSSFICCFFETSAVIYRRNKGTSHRKC
jgi:hypothetical protein